MSDYSKACAAGGTIGAAAGTVATPVGSVVGGAVGCIGGILVTAADEPAIKGEIALFEKRAQRQGEALMESYEKLGQESFTTSAQRVGQATLCNLQEVFGTKWVSGC